MVKLKFFATVQSCSLEACSLHGKARNPDIQLHEHLFKSYCGIIFDSFFLQKEMRFKTINFVDSHLLYDFSLAEALRKSLLLWITPAVQVR